MSKHSNKLQNWISKSEQAELEQLVIAIEQKYPLEVVIALTDTPAVVPFAAARMIALLAVVIELIAEAFWIPVPAWALGLTVFFALMLPAQQWQGFGLFRLISFKGERYRGVTLQTDKCFSDLGLARTKARNAVLVFFNVKEKIYILRPDQTLASEWPELNLNDLVAEVGNQLDKSASPASASLELVKKISALAEQRWPDAQPTASINELPNGVAWWQR